MEFLVFCNFTGKTPTEIHDIHKKDLIEHTPEFDMWLTSVFDDYVTYLIRRNHTYDTIRTYIGVIKTFLNSFRLRPTPEVEINKKRILEDAKYALKVDDIRKAISHSNLTYQTIIVTQAQTGLSISDVVLLDVEDFVLAVMYSDKAPQFWPIEREFNINDVKESIKKVKADDNLIGCFDMRRKKSLNEFYTFAGPEALRKIASLLETRDEKYLTPDSPVFMRQTCRLPKKQRDDEFLELRLDTEAIITYFKRFHSMKKIFPKIVVDGRKKNFFRSHKLRKWFANKVRFDAGLSFDDTKYLMGQKTGDVLERYIHPNDYKVLKDNYRKALPFLAITDEIIVEENQEAIEKLANENLELKKSMKNQRLTNINLIEEMERLNERMGLIEKLENDKEYNERHH